MPCVDEVLPVVDSTSIDESVSSLDAHLLMLFVYSCSYTTKGEKQEANGDETRGTTQQMYQRVGEICRRLNLAASTPPHPSISKGGRI